MMKKFVLLIIYCLCWKHVDGELTLSYTEKLPAATDVTHVILDRDIRLQENQRCLIKKHALYTTTVMRKTMADTENYLPSLDDQCLTADLNTTSLVLDRCYRDYDVERVQNWSFIIHPNFDSFDKIRDVVMHAGVISLPDISRPLFRSISRRTLHKMDHLGQPITIERTISFGKPNVVFPDADELHSLIWEIFNRPTNLNTYSETVNDNDWSSANKENISPNGVEKFSYDALNKVTDPNMPPETKKIVVQGKPMKVVSASDGGYYVNGYHVPGNFKLDKNQLAKFTKQVVDVHNRLRAKHNTSPLTLKPEISKYSQWWANELLKNKSLQHSPKSKRPYPLGENIYWSGVSYVPGNVPVEAWYAEGNDVHYNYTTNKPTPGAGHYTQVLWASSTFIGVGISSDPKKGVFVVCNYEPPGNVIDHFRENIHPPVD